MNITLTQSVRIAGVEQAAGTKLTVSDDIGEDLIRRKSATNDNPTFEPEPVMATKNLTGGIEVLEVGGRDAMSDLGIKMFQPGASWGKIKSTFMGLSQGAVAQPVVLQFGDSVTQYVSGYCINTLSGQFTEAGRGLGAVGQFETTSGDVESVTGDYTYWPNGTHTRVGAGGVIRFGPNNGQAFNARKFHAFLVTHPGGGSATVDVVDPWGTVVDTQTVSTVGPVALTPVSFTASSTTLARVRVTGVSGDTIVVGVAAWNTGAPGIVRCDMGVGGLQLTLANTANPEILAGVMEVLRPAACFYSMREVSNDDTHLANPASWITDPVLGVKAMIDKFSVGFVSPWVMISPTPAAFDAGKTVDTAPSAIEGAALRSVCEANGWAFFDSYAALGSSWEAVVARGNSGNDGIHIGAIEQRILAEAFYTETGFGHWPGMPSAQDVRASNVSATRLYLLKDATQAAGGANLGTSGGGEDIYANVTRWMDIRHTGGQRAARFSSGGGADGGAGAIFSSNAGFCANANYFESDGDYSICVNGTTGAVTLYGRVGGVIKSLSLGTLA